jgi:hypothetical protein
MKTQKFHKLRSQRFPDLTMCWRHVRPAQMAAFSDSVTCRACLKAMEFNAACADLRRQVTK